MDFMRLLVGAGLIGAAIGYPSHVISIYGDKVPIAIAFVAIIGTVLLYGLWRREGEYSKSLKLVIILCVAVSAVASYMMLNDLHQIRKVDVANGSAFKFTEEMERYQTEKEILNEAGLEKYAESIDRDVYNERIQSERFAKEKEVRDYARTFRRVLKSKGIEKITFTGAPPTSVLSYQILHEGMEVYIVIYPVGIAKGYVSTEINNNAQRLVIDRRWMIRAYDTGFYQEFLKEFRYKEFELTGSAKEVADLVASHLTE